VIYESFSGKNGVDEIISEPIIENTRVIGLRDKDYLQEVINERMFLYDFSCLEMMLISRDEVFQNICHEFIKDMILMMNLET